MRLYKKIMSARSSASPQCRNLLGNTQISSHATMNLARPNGCSLLKRVAKGRNVLHVTVCFALIVGGGNLSHLTCCVVWLYQDKTRQDKRQDKTSQAKRQTRQIRETCHALRFIYLWCLHCSAMLVEGGNVSHVTVCFALFYIASSCFDLNCL